MSDPRQAVLDALLAERYGPSLWWKKPDPPNHGELADARARLELIADEDEDD
jgi:hypothetical protein